MALRGRIGKGEFEVEGLDELIGVLAHGANFLNSLAAGAEVITKLVETVKNGEVQPKKLKSAKVEPAELGTTAKPKLKAKAKRSKPEAK